jgi:hypothetical protein
MVALTRCQTIPFRGSGAGSAAALCARVRRQVVPAHSHLQNGQPRCGAVLSVAGLWPLVLLVLNQARYRFAERGLDLAAKGFCECVLPCCGFCVLTAVVRRREVSIDEHKKQVWSASRGSRPDFGCFGQITLSKIFFWYHNDFAATDDGMLTFIAKYLSDDDDDVVSTSWGSFARFRVLTLLLVCAGLGKEDLAYELDQSGRLHHCLQRLCDCCFFVGFRLTASCDVQMIGG